MRFAVNPPTHPILYQFKIQIKRYTTSREHQRFDFPPCCDAILNLNSKNINFKFLFDKPTRGMVEWTVSLACSSPTKIKDISQEVCIHKLR